MAKIYTLISNNDDVLYAVKSWTKINTSVVKEIRGIIRDLELGGIENPDKEDIESVKENFLMPDDPKIVVAQWKNANHLAQMIWTDDMDEFHIVATEVII